MNVIRLSKEGIQIRRTVGTQKEGSEVGLAFYDRNAEGFFPAAHSSIIMHQVPGRCFQTASNCSEYLVHNLFLVIAQPHGRDFVDARVPFKHLDVYIERL